MRYVPHLLLHWQKTGCFVTPEVLPRLFVPSSPLGVIRVDQLKAAAKYELVDIDYTAPKWKCTDELLKVDPLHVKSSKHGLRCEEETHSEVGQGRQVGNSTRWA